MFNEIDKIRTFVIYNEVSKILGAINFPCCVVKGKTLAGQAYNDFSCRMSGDVDFIIERNRIKSFENILIQYGYSCLSKDRSDRILCLNSSHQIPPYVKNRSGINIEIDINFDIFWGEYTGKRVDVAEFLSDTIDMDIYGVKVKTLPPLKSMVQIALHHYKDMNSIFLLATRKSIKYDMFKDVYYLLKNNLVAISLDKLCAMSADYEIIPYVYYVLYHTGLLFDDDILKEYISAFKTPEGETLLNCYGLTDVERREWKCDFKMRLESKNIYDLIKGDLTLKDMEKITINKKVNFGG